MDITQRRPAVVSADYPTQRYYSESASTRPIRETNQPQYSYRSSVDVLRIARILLTPTELRRLASDLLDAADDIEQNPAAVLAADQQEAA